MSNIPVLILLRFLRKCSSEKKMESGKYIMFKKEINLY